MKGLCHSCLASNVEIAARGGRAVCERCAGKEAGPPGGAGGE